MENFEITTTLTPEEIDKATARMRHRKGLFIRIFETIILGLLFLNYLVSFIADTSYTTAISMMGICVTILAVVWLIPHFTIRAKNNDEEKTATYIFCEENIIFGGSEVPYTQIENVLQTPELLIIMFDEQHMSAISKKSVGEENFKKACDILKEKKGRNYKISKK